jgi:hypothetical protein
MVDHAGLQAASDALARGAVPTPPKANAGTTMVCRVLNAIKVDFPFVDLLKPEDAPLMAVMAAIDMPTSYGGLTDALLARLPRKQWGELLGENADAEPPLAGPEREVDQFLSGAPIAANDGTEVLRRVEDWMDQDKVRRPRDLVPVEDERLRSLGDYGRVKLQRIRSAVARLRGTPNEVSLRHALVNWLARDESFDIGRLSAIDLRIVDAAPHGVDLVIAGHTHVPRHQQGVPEYINTGTWMRVLKLTGSEYLQSDAKFRQFFDVVGKKHALAQLDQLDIDPRARPVAVVDARQAGLYSVVVKGKAGSLQRLLRG